MHQPIFLKDISLGFPNKSCFENFSTAIYPGQRIAIIGRNGGGKSSLLNIIRQQLSPSEGAVVLPNDLCMGYVEQTIRGHDDLSGGQRLNKRLSEALALSPDILLLDEPTNHLDLANRKSLMRMLQTYRGTLLVVSHDTELLRRCIDTIWHIDQNQIQTFTGAYDDYISTMALRRDSIEKEIGQLKRDKKAVHADLMKEQKRASKSKAKGKKSIVQRKWPTVVSNAKASRSEKTSGKKQSAIDQKKHLLEDQLSGIHLAEIIVPTFSLNSAAVSRCDVVTIRGADIGYDDGKMVLSDVNMTVPAHGRIAICGNNGSGKSTFLSAIVGKSSVKRAGDWYLPDPASIGFLDQHYANLDPTISVIEHVCRLRPEWLEREARRHLNDFLFRTNEEVGLVAANLSGGERARLSLALIAAKTPKLLVLDEMTNNLDLETKDHVIQVLKAYPGAMIVVSHEEDFLQSIGVDQVYQVDDGRINPVV